MSQKYLDERGGAEAPPAPGNLTATRLFLFGLTVVAVPALVQLFDRGKNTGQWFATYSLKWAGMLGFAVLLGLSGLAVLILLMGGGRQRLTGWAGTVLRQARHSRWIAVLAYLMVWVGYVAIVFYRLQYHFADSYVQVWLFFLSVGVGAFFLSAVWRRASGFWALLLTTLLYGVGVKALGYLPDISAIPFTLSWSEGSRYFYASLPASRWLYGEAFPLSPMHPTRYLMQGLAFLVPGAGIAFHRAWQVFLWLAFSFLAGWMLARRFRGARTAVTVGITIWAALFLLQGPVYYHLLVPVALVLGGFDRDRFWKTMGFVMLASLWAGMSRVNWIPVPAMLAVTLYLMEKPVCSAERPGDRSPDGPAVWLRYLWQPAAWSAAGLLAALASQTGYMLVSGHEELSQFGSSFTSALLWYRLMPSPTFPMGVIPATLLVSAPLLALLVGNWAAGRRHWHLLRIAGIVLMLLVLLGGGLVVSAKIGGGSNLHNMDAYLALLMTAGAAAAWGRFASETGERPRAWRPWPVILALVVIPVVWNLGIGDPFVRRDPAQAALDLNRLNGYVQEYAQQGEVLFITQRQLQVFGMIPGVKVVPEYELITLTEMSMANNRAYLERFYQDLRSHRFSVIITDRQQVGEKDPEHNSFAEENNAWAQNIARPLLEYYQEETYLEKQGIQLLVPKQ